MSTISRWLDHDLNTGEVVRVIGSATLNGNTHVLVLHEDGSHWVYLSQQEANATGEIARQVVMPADLSSPGQLTYLMFEYELNTAFLYRD